MWVITLMQKILKYSILKGKLHEANRKKNIQQENLQSIRYLPWQQMD